MRKKDEVVLVAKQYDLESIQGSVLLIVPSGYN